MENDNPEFVQPALGQRTVWTWRGQLITDMSHEGLIKAFGELAGVHKAMIDRAVKDCERPFFTPRAASWEVAPTDLYSDMRSTTER